MSNRISTTVLATALLITATLTLAATPKEAVGFFGKVTGVVKSVKSDGTSFTMTVSSAEPDANSAVKDPHPMIGKILTLGTRMPKGSPHPDDVAYIKTLKPGMKITVHIFALKADPSVLRVTGPGESATTQPATKPAH